MPTLLSYSKGRFVFPGDSEKVSSVEAVPFTKNFELFDRRKTSGRQSRELSEKLNSIHDQT